MFATLKKQAQQHAATVNEDKILDMAHALRAERSFNNDERLYMLYPKMFVTPDYARTKQIKEQQKKTASELMQQVEKRQKSVDDMARKQRVLAQEMNQRLITKADDVANERADKRKRMASEACRNWHEHTAAQEVHR